MKTVQTIIDEADSNVSVHKTESEVSFDRLRPPMAKIQCFCFYCWSYCCCHYQLCSNFL